MSSDPIQIRSSSWLTKKTFPCFLIFYFNPQLLSWVGALYAKPCILPNHHNSQDVGMTSSLPKPTILINFFDKFVSAESLLGFDIHPITSSCIATLLPLNPTFDPIPIWLESDFNPIMLIDEFLKSNFKSISQNVPKKLNKSSPGRCRTPNVGRWEQFPPK